MTEAVEVIEVLRGSIVESRHRGMISVVDACNHKLVSFGDTSSVTYLRSLAKPFQALPLVSSGASRHFGINSRELAVMCGSHSGEAIHTETVAGLLNKISLSEKALQCGAHAPFDVETAQRLDPSEITQLHNNCSGKHAGMLALARFHGYDIESYLNPDHPIQREILNIVALFASMKLAEIGIGVDGCSAPTFAVPIEKIALLYARLVNPGAADLPESLAESAAEVVWAMIENPEFVAGTKNRLDTDLMRASPGRLIPKVGAEGVYAVGVLPCNRFPDGVGIAVKIEDGDARGIQNLVVVEVLRQLGLLDDATLNQLSHYRSMEVRNHRGLLVGEIQPCFLLSLSYE